MKRINHLKIVLTAIALTTLLAPALSAQRKNPRASARTAQILYFKSPRGAPESAVIYHGENDPITVHLPRNNFSSSIKLAPGEINLRFLPSILSEDQSLPIETPSLIIPKGWKKILILAFHDPKNSVFPIRFKAINANPQRLNNGDRMFINFTDNQVFGLVGSKQLSLRGKSTAIIKNAAAPKEEYLVRLDRINPKDKKRLTFIRQTWRHSPTRRSIIFIYSPPNSTSITYYNAPVRDL